MYITYLQRLVCTFEVLSNDRIMISAYRFFRQNELGNLCYICTFEISSTYKYFVTGRSRNAQFYPIQLRSNQVWRQLSRCLITYLAAITNKKLSYCWETVRRESMPRIAEMDVEMTT